jgi:hypothetical protein
MGFSARLAPRARALAVLVACASSALARPALAEPTASQKETARTMMDEGHARREAGDHAAALAQFQGADAIMQVPTTGLEVGREQVALGQLVEARDTFERVTRAAPSPNEPDAFRVARKAADALDQAIATRIPSLRITETGIPAGSAIVVTVDGAPIPLAALIAPIKVNPGHHVVSASAGSASARREVDVAEGQSEAVALTLAPATIGSPPEAEPAPSETTSEPSSVGWLRWGGVGLAGMGAAVGAITGAMSLSSASTASRGCVNDRCPPATWGDIDSARTTGTISTVAFAAAGVGAVLAVTSFAIGGRRGRATTTGGSTTSRPGAELTAGVGPGSAWVGGRF